MQGRAHVGGHVTLIFSVQDEADNLLHQGSRGAGMSLDRGVIVEASAKPGSGQLQIEGDAPSNHLHRLVFEELTAFEPIVNDFDWTIHHSCELPPSQGFGLSAAGAIACGLAIQRTLQIEEELARN